MTAHAAATTAPWLGREALLPIRKVDGPGILPLPCGTGASAPSVRHRIYEADH